jgi:flagellin
MPIGILNNIPSLEAENELNLTSTALNNTLEQLSSGQRINTGADDPAGLAIANGLQANIAALTQSVSNANDGVGELQLADGALAQVTTLLDTAVTLATESATGTVSNAQRTAIQAQYSSILAEINRIGTSTTYNSQAVFQNGTQPNLNEQNSPVAAGTLNLNDVLTSGDTTTISAGGQTFTYTAATTSGTNPNGVVGSATGITASTALAAADVITLTRGTGTTTYTVGASGSTVGELIQAVDSGASTTNITVAGTDTGGHTGYQATIQNGSIQFQDLTNQGDLTVGETGTTLGATFANPTTASSTVQDLINAINADTTVGAKAALVSGTLEITDPQNRGDLAVTTDDTVLGAPVQGAPTAFTTPNTTGVSTPNTNELVSSAGSLTNASAIANGTTTITAGGKTFTYTASGGTGTVGALINAINNPTTDPALLTAYLNSSGNLVITDPNANNDIAAGATVATALGTLSNPLQTGAAETNIFLSDATSIGSSQIGVIIGGLSSSSITNGNGEAAVNLSGSDLSTQSDAQSALTLIDQAIANVASSRGVLGASVDRLTSASNVINSQVQNLTSAENTILAADIPTAVANLTKYSILEQTGISALAQANQQQQLVLKLLQ